MSISSKALEYLTGRLIAEDAIWELLYDAEIPKSSHAIKDDLFTEKEINIAEEKVDWILLHSKERFQKNRDKWALKAWHISKSEAFVDKYYHALESSELILNSDDLSNLINMNSPHNKIQNQMTCSFLKANKSVVSNLGPYWMLNKWKEEPLYKKIDTLLGQAIKEEFNKTPRANYAYLYQILLSFNIILPVTTIQNALRLVSANSSIDFYWQKGLIKPLNKGYWIISEAIPAIVDDYSKLTIADYEKYEELLFSVEQGRFKKERLKDGFSCKHEIKKPVQIHTPVKDEEISLIGNVPANERNMRSLSADKDNYTEQSEAIKAEAWRRILVLSGPGSGKTEVVARRLAHLTSDNCGLKPSQILILSFSRSAVKVLLNRIKQVVDCSSNVDYEDLRHISVRTFDSWSFRMLRFAGLTARELLRNSYEDNIRLLTARLKNLKSNEADMVIKQELNNISHIIVDECQDLSGVRADLTKELLLLMCPNNAVTEDKSRCGFTILGDLNQAIYGWRKQSDTLTSEGLIGFVRQYYAPKLKEISLQMNHRSNLELADLQRECANLFMSANRSAISGEMLRRAESIGMKCTVDNLGSYCADNGGSKASFAILCRTNLEALYLAQKIQKEFSGTNMHFSLQAGEPPKIIPAWVSYILGRFTAGAITKSNFNVLFDRTIGRCGVKIGSLNGALAWNLLVRACKKPATATSLEMDELREKITYTDAFPDDEDVDQPNIIFTNIHRSKGQEFDSVVLVNSFDGDESEDETKVLYVGISRAKEYLFIVDKIDAPRFYPKTQASGTKRQHRLEADNEWLHMLEMGLEGDIDPFSFIDINLHNNSQEIDRIQDILFEKKDILIGSSVILIKKSENINGRIRVHYDIVAHLETDYDITLGRTSAQLTEGILNTAPRAIGFHLPERIDGLRITQITSIVGPDNMPVHVEERRIVSRLWLGINIYGIGLFRFTW